MFTFQTVAVFWTFGSSMAVPIRENGAQVRLNDIYSHDELKALLADRSNLETTLAAERRITKWYCENVSKMEDFFWELTMNNDCEATQRGLSGPKRGQGGFLRIAKGGLRRRLPRGLDQSYRGCRHCKIKMEIRKFTKGRPLPLYRNKIGLQEDDAVSDLLLVKLLWIVTYLSFFLV